MTFLNLKSICQNPDKKIEDSLYYSIKDGCYHALMLGFGEAYLIAFAVFLKAGNLIVGLTSTLPMLIGSIAQLLSLRLLQKNVSRKVISTRAAFLQGLVWIPLFLMPWLFKNEAPYLFLLFCIFYFGFGHAVAPSWNSWMGDLVNENIRGRYFGYRFQLRNFCELIAFLSAGFFLYRLSQNNNQWLGFAGLFFLAFICRMISAFNQTKIFEPKSTPLNKDEYFSFYDFIKRVKKSNFSKFSFLVAFLLLATNISSPFFSLYMLRDLKMNYLQFSIALSMSMIGQTITVYNWGKIADRFGNKKIIEVTALIVGMIPLLWLTTTNIYFVFLFQFIGGSIWAGFNLCSANFLFDSVKPAKRSWCVAYYNILAHVGVFSGALIGGLIGPELPTSISIWNLKMNFLSSLPVLFLISALLRFIPAFFMIHYIHEVRDLRRVSSWQVMRSMISLYINPEFGSRFFSLFNRKK